MDGKANMKMKSDWNENFETWKTKMKRISNFKGQKYILDKGINLVSETVPV